MGGRKAASGEGDDDAAINSCRFADDQTKDLEKKRRAFRAGTSFGS